MPVVLRTSMGVQFSPQRPSLSRSNQNPNRFLETVCEDVRRLRRRRCWVGVWSRFFSGRSSTTFIEEPAAFMQNGCVSPSRSLPRPSLTVKLLVLLLPLSPFGRPDFGRPDPCASGVLTGRRWKSGNRLRTVAVRWTVPSLLRRDRRPRRPEPPAGGRPIRPRAQSGGRVR